MSIGNLRKENLKTIVNIHGTQTKLAGVLDHEVLTQQIISAVVTGKRLLSPSEARLIEQRAGIPNNWIDKYPLKKAWPLLMKFKNLDKDSQEIFNGLLIFSEKQDTELRKSN